VKVVLKKKMKTLSERVEAELEKAHSRFRQWERVLELTYKSKKQAELLEKFDASLEKYSRERDEGDCSAEMKIQMTRYIANRLRGKLTDNEDARMIEANKQVALNLRLD
jgi:hypothetical protein